MIPTCGGVSALAGVSCHSDGDVVRFVLGRRLRREQSSKSLLDRRPVAAGCTETREDLIVVLGGGAFTEAGATDGVCVFPRLGGMVTNLCVRYRLGSGRSRHEPAPRVHRR